MVKNRAIIGGLIEHSIPILFCLAALGTFRWLLRDFGPAMVLNVGLLEKFGLWLGLSSIGAYFAIAVGNLLSSKAVEQLLGLRAPAVSFSFTAGDENDHVRQVARHNQTIKKFFLTSIWALIINVVAAYVAVRLGVAGN